MLTEQWQNDARIRRFVRKPALFACGEANDKIRYSTTVYEKLFVSPLAGLHPGFRETHHISQKKSFGTSLHTTRPMKGFLPVHFMFPPVFLAHTPICTQIQNIGTTNTRNARREREKSSLFGHQ